VSYDPWKNVRKICRPPGNLHDPSLPYAVRVAPFDGVAVEIRVLEDLGLPLSAELCEPLLAAALLDCPLDRARDQVCVGGPYLKAVRNK
jgi:hypothetical protein